jgi:hypothetical protein
MQPSAPVLTSLARVLRLDDDQRAYMNELAGTPAKTRRRAPQKVKPYLQRILDRMHAPAIVMTPTHDILAWNSLTAALMVDFGEVPERERNFVRLLFTDPACGRCTRRDLSIRDAQFRQWWAGTHVAVKRRGARRYSHPSPARSRSSGTPSPPMPSRTSSSSSTRRSRVLVPSRRCASSPPGLRSTSIRPADRGPGDPTRSLG